MPKLSMVAPSLAALTLVALALAGTAQHAGAATAREIRWDDLLPAELVEAGQALMKMEERIVQLPDDQRATYETVGAEMLLRQKLESGKISEDELLDSERELLADAPAKRHPEIVAELDSMVAMRMRANGLAKAVEPTLNGSRVRIPGYVLPLEFDGTLVREFLLVPYVGACIHVPAPPANQMVFVRSSVGFDIPELYAPVWVEGLMTTSGVTRDLTLVDGQAPVEAGYSLDAEEVSLFER